MRTVKQGESVSRETSVVGDVVTVQHVTAHPVEGDMILTWKFDYENVTREELLLEAVRSHKIDMRVDFKKERNAEKLAAYDGKEFNMREWLDKERRKAVSKMKKAENLFEKLSPEERARIIAMYESKDEE